VASSLPRTRFTQLCGDISLKSTFPFHLYSDGIGSSGGALEATHRRWGKFVMDIQSVSV